MPVRDRLKELQFNYEEEEEADTNDKKGKNDKKEMKNFIKECEATRQNFLKIHENAEKIQTFLKDHRCYKFEELQNGVKPISKETDKIIQKISQKIKEFHIDKEDVERIPTANNKMKFMQYTSLREGFKLSLDSYLQAMKLYENTLDKFKTGIEKAVHGTEYDETQPLTGREQDQIFIGDYFAEKWAVEQQLRDVEERHDILLQIEQQLTEVKDLFIQIAILIDQQQESVNRAEYHAAISTRAVEMATHDLESAKKKKKKVTKLKIILITVAVIILIIVLIMLFR